ncbi:MAG: MiaB/RimO family radical SAM methylthiotransferase [Pseudodesulfovibrio sp.]|uniref:RNA modification enzyme, MiaB family n=1 Tax=Pseudodesulfovibrio aespoeensis (strain ATCC 700646 / DSM 10631 / Aspo-2) TaxID=643562 RepID=E6VTN5_PSEA9|nr:MULTISPECIES: MiaB/RimO family radical SAM methylthiotransferase [Pseudodesulfovibrio]MBU4191983.1 MiaB/RimO family radical SAM methylthiotransferase [Pseudomonadota bacterium]ADU63322.1 RNA modification enzyme, MiaB family [Pseudodesulfovibrio aespoeensis Aspo-2]MBU4244444.1 MiaB/RimO family radical SAM methylthiotransferase [Pseudomonadota bacterium]MBU4377755.1 MiaB/RimO family radical SAM methylthiotransferase [Pseudomonadota bacterium]MBU4474940.1 MiaB/RimO family radical SAM methylthi
MIRFYTATLGCKINQYETRSIAEAWTGHGQAFETGAPQEADLILINSCAVTANAVADLRQTVRSLHRASPTAGIIVTGCAAQVMADELAGLPGVVRVVPQADKGALLAGPAAPPVSPAVLDGEAGALGGFAPFSITGYSRARAVVKVQDGCSHHCTYCIVPQTRGPSVSRPVDAVVAEAVRLLDSGFRELVISGINLRHYGRGLQDRTDFWDLLARLDRELAPRWAGRARLRVSSVEPGQLDHKALDTLAGSSMVCPQLHLSLQSGDPDVLRAMGRGHYDPQGAVDFLIRLGEAWPVIGLGADLITGFPGEDEAGFENTLTLCRVLPLTYAHVFPYSERPGTAAATMAGQVAVPVRKERATRLRALVSRRKRAFGERLLGRPCLDVLVQDQLGRGVSEFYAGCRLTRLPDGAGPRSLVSARPVGLDRGVIVAEPLAASMTDPQENAS